MLGIIASIIDGVLVGLVYGLSAMGLTLIWGVMDVINLTHGTMIVGGMFALYFLATGLGVPPYLALLPVLVGGFLAGVALYWIAVHRMVGRPPLMSLLSTFAVNLVLIGIGTGVWGTALFNVAVSLPGVSLGRYTFPGAHILAAVPGGGDRGRRFICSCIAPAWARRCARSPIIGKPRSWSAFRPPACLRSRSVAASRSPASPAC